MFWLVGFVLQISFVISRSGECDPEHSKHWYPVQNDTSKFFFCHPTKRVFQLDECQTENNIPKSFDFALQKCVLPNITADEQHLPSTFELSTSQKDEKLQNHAPKQQFGTVPSLDTIGQKILGRLPEYPRAFNELDVLECPRERTALKVNGNNVECSAAPGQDDPSLLHCGPDGHYRCSFFSKIGDRGICCSRLDAGQIKCPPKMTAVVGKDGSVRACNPRRVGSCRGEGSVCVFDEEQGDFHCCQVDAAEYEDIEDDLEASTMNYLAIGMKQQRPPKYINRPRKYSKDIEDINGCRNGEIPFLDHNKVTLECSDDKVTCPPGFQCYRSRRYQRYICCGVNKGYCPSNSAVLIGPKQRKVSCGPLSGCPEGFYCHKSSHSCCSLEPTAGICEQGLPFINTDGKARYCEETCPKGYKCTKRFKKSVCCPEAQHVCTQPLNIGLHCMMAKSHKQFYYHSESGECRPFIYTGCSGNDNRFESIKLCEDHCHLSSICPVGPALRLANGNMATCSEHVPCPLPEYTCHSTGRGQFCCPSIENFEICPSEAKPYVVSGRPVECHKATECPSNYDCHRPNYHAMGHCCEKPAPMPSPKPITILKPTVRNLPKYKPRPMIAKPTEPMILVAKCADGKTPLRAPDGEIQVCIMNKEMECPNGFKCELDEYLGRFQCCPSNSNTAAEQTCPSGFGIHYNLATGQVIPCDPDVILNSCHRFGMCRYSEQYERHICCTPNSLEGMLRIEQNNSSPQLWSGIHPGGAGCLTDTQCDVIYPKAKCEKGVCKCPGRLKAHQGKCDAECPVGYSEVDGMCTISSSKLT
ncbi:unnamed protein product [Bursaphelenchus okinawaensis]|uniref:BPTI/Kunitz inhibitor domain-containing protein n=1 Tax=Bursaphelenchus okinawaensis TaxID=465554 RepID=A0A811K504_9BILA|nr:unnamed protein product [Bursaphelenchus okinawaensis]CAG9091446.1 unnamed protein product [Bursaphelenchus okinawaensis]